MRAIRLPGLEKAILSDTVGFISDLPTQLVAAFRATLEEVTAADLILHVRDIANPDTESQKRQVLDVLGDLGVLGSGEGADGEGEAEPAIPMIEVWNKWDLLDPDQIQALHEAIAHRVGETIVPISALTGQGCDKLLETVGNALTEDAKLYSFLVPAADGQRIAFLHARGEVVSEEDAGEGEEGPLLRMQVRLSERELGRFGAL